MTIPKPWFNNGSAAFSPAGLLARLKNAIKIEIPVGYQDETGFHSGVKTAEQEIKWPTTW
jgi:peptide subunit release factor 1 (eRF1)